MDDAGETPEKRTSEASEGRRPNTGRSSARAIVAAVIAQGGTLKVAAVKGGVCARTVRRWKQEPAFRARVERLSKAAVNRSLRQLSASMSGAATTLRGLLTSEDENVRCRAARSVIELGMRLAESAELKDRVAELERRLDAAEQAAEMMAR